MATDAPNVWRERSRGWQLDEQAREGGLRALRPGKRGRRPGSGHLSRPQAVRIRKLIIEQMPDPTGAAVLPVDPRIGRGTDRARVRHQGVEVDGWGDTVTARAN